MSDLVRSVLVAISALTFSVLAFSVSGAFGQQLPNHVDPSAREDVPDASRVPAIRFLTTPDFPPFNYRDANGALVGFHIDLARAICDSLELVCTVQAWPWDQAPDALDDGQGDALIGGLAIDEISGDRFDFSSIYFAFPARFVVPREAAPSFDASSLDAMKISVRKGSRHAALLTRQMPKAQLVQADTELAALEMVENGEAAAFFGDAMRASFWLNSNNACCSFAGDAYFRPDYFGEGLAIALPAGHDDIRALINAALVRLKKTGALDELYLRWFPVSFY